MSAMMNKDKKWVSNGTFLIIGILTVIILVRYYAMNSLTMFVVMGAIHCLILVGVYIGKCSRCYLLYLVAGVAWIVLGTMNDFEGFNFWKIIYFVMAMVVIVTGLSGYYVRIKRKESLIRLSWKQIIIFVLLIAFFGGTWGFENGIANASASRATRSVWAVPDQFDEQSCKEEGTITKISYETKAYATDDRRVEKMCNVYLPYGYDDSKRYNILYLMHGTGDDEDYWMIQNTNNKTMVDNLIYHGEIEPLIIVTPTWYVEDDCSEELDQLTYSFSDELRNDLMPFIESQYSTYADGVTDADFEKSREHRAFAGLSRGSVTMFHSAMEQNLDAFAWFGGFSASRLMEQEWRATAMSEKLGSYSISYLYMTTGTSDFAAKRQLKDYRMLISLDRRLKEGVNTSFDMFPMRYHSAGSWHLALYNYLQKIF